ncbi:MAG: septum formation initiator family protein [Balneola sp.]
MKTELLNPIHWKKSVLVVILSTFILIWFGFVDSYSLLTRIGLNNQKADLREKIEKLNASTEDLKTKIDHLHQDAQLLEKIAREEYGMRKPGETVYKVRRSE